MDKDKGALSLLETTICLSRSDLNFTSRVAGDAVAKAPVNTTVTIGSRKLNYDITLS